MTDPSWWLEEWSCPLCRTTITKHHRSRHLKSQGHLDRTKPVPDDPMNIRASDLQFTIFLSKLDVRTFSGVEKELYNAARLNREMLR